MSLERSTWLVKKPVQRGQRKSAEGGNERLRGSYSRVKRKVDKGDEGMMERKSRKEEIYVI